MAVQRILHSGYEGACSECHGHGKVTSNIFWPDRGETADWRPCDHCGESGYEPPTTILSCWEWLRSPAV